MNEKIQGTASSEPVIEKPVRPAILTDESAEAHVESGDNGLDQFTPPDTHHVSLDTEEVSADLERHLSQSINQKKFGWTVFGISTTGEWYIRQPKRGNKKVAGRREYEFVIVTPNIPYELYKQEGKKEYIAEAIFKGNITQEPTVSEWKEKVKKIRTSDDTSLQAQEEIRTLREKLTEAEENLAAALKTPTPKDDAPALAEVKRLQEEIKKVSAELAKKPKEVIKEVPKEWTGNTLEEWMHGPKHIEGDKAARMRAGLKAQTDNHISAAEKMGHAKALYKQDQMEKQKPFGWKMGLGALLGGVALSSLASPIAGMFGIAGLSGLAWRGITSLATAFAVGGLTARRLEKRNFKNPGTWGLVSGILAGLGSFIGGEYIASLIGGSGVSTNGDLVIPAEPGTTLTPEATPPSIPKTSPQSSPFNPLGLSDA